MRRFFRLIGRGIADLSLHPATNFMSIFTMVLAIFLGGTFLIALTTVDKELSVPRGEAVWQVFWSPKADMVRVQEQWDEMRSMPWLMRMETWTSEQAMERLGERLKEHAAGGQGGKADVSAKEGGSGLLSAIHNNPLPATAKLVFIPQTPDAEAWSKSLHDHFTSLEGVERISATPLKDELARLWRGMSIFVVWPSITLLCFVLALISANSVRITLVERRDEIAILRLVGARNWYIRLPLLTSGVFMGFVSGGIALAALFFLFERFSHLFSIPPLLMALHFPPLEQAALLVLVPMLMGFLGGWLAVRGR